MNGPLLGQIAGLFSGLSLVSIGGANALLPEMHRQVVDVHHWMTDAQFADVFAISAAAPGPNIIIVSLIGWRLAGLAGLVVATLAIMIPSGLLAFTAARGLARWSDHHWTRRIRAGLVPLALGLILASSISMMRIADRNLLAFLITAGAAAYVLWSRWNPVWALAASALLAIVAVRLGIWAL